MTAKMAAAQEYYVWIPLRGGHLSCHFFGISSCTSCWKKLFSGDFIGKIRELIICKFDHFSLFFHNNSVENYRSDIPKYGKEAAWWALHLCRQKFSSKMNISTVIFEKLKKMLKIADFAKFGPKYLGPQIFPRHAVCGSKLEI